MPKVPTNWSNNDVKPAASWTPATKGKSVWANNVTKSLTAFTSIVRNLVSWGNESTTQVPYLYDSATLTYDSATRSYDYTNPQTNQLNGLNKTPWSAT